MSHPGAPEAAYWTPPAASSASRACGAVIRPLARRVGEGAHHPRGELATAAPLELHRRRLHGQRIWAIGRASDHGIERLGHRAHLRQTWNLLAAQAVGVALAVPPLVVVVEDRHLTAEAGDGGEELGAGARMVGKVVPRLGRQKGPLVAMADLRLRLAEVVEAAAAHQGGQRRIANPELLPDLGGVDRGAAAMAAPVAKGGGGGALQVVEPLDEHSHRQTRLRRADRRRPRLRHAPPRRRFGHRHRLLLAVVVRPHLLGKGGDVDRLLDVAVAAGAQTALAVAGQDVGRDRDDRHVGEGGHRL